MPASLPVDRDLHLLFLSVYVLGFDVRTYLYFWCRVSTVKLMVVIMGIVVMIKMVMMMVLMIMMIVITGSDGSNSRMKVTATTVMAPAW